MLTFLRVSLRVRYLIWSRIMQEAQSVKKYDIHVQAFKYIFLYLMHKISLMLKDQNKRDTKRELRYYKRYIYFK